MPLTRPRVRTHKPVADCCRNVDGGEEIRGVSVVSRCDAPKVLQPAEHPFDGVPVSVKDWREAIFPFPVGLGRDVRHRAAILDLATDSVGVIAFVGVANVAGGKLFEQYRTGGTIGDMAAAEHEGQWAAQSIGQRVDFCRSPTPRATNRLIFLPPCRLRPGDAP